jgi:hypothetical protein
MAVQINSKKVKYFRWHDSGDVQNLDHLNKIYEVCKLTPDVKHWMPTREAWVKDHLDSCPDNLIIRLSAPMVDQAAPESWPHTSTVVTSGRTCPAPDQGNQCKDCRACWDKDECTYSNIQNITKSIGVEPKENKPASEPRKVGGWARRTQAHKLTSPQAIRRQSRWSASRPRIEELS